MAEKSNCLSLNLQFSQYTVKLLLVQLFSRKAVEALEILVDKRVQCREVTLWFIGPDNLQLNSLRTQQTVVQFFICVYVTELFILKHLYRGISDEKTPRAAAVASRHGEIGGIQLKRNFL
ncbi:hypothetical protein LINPERHAP1_LOCUS41643 [Linum perenne]